MYPITKTNKGYEFVTNSGIRYNLYFTSLDHLSSVKFNNPNLSINNFQYFGIEKMNDINGVKDIFVKRTIASIMYNFFVIDPEGVIVFNYSNTDYKIKSRRRLFKKWIDEYSRISLLQFYQHDFSDEVSVCAIYNRRGGKDFEHIRNDIQSFINSLDDILKH